MPEPLVSIIMNCYNGESYLREAIDSVLSQTYKNWELIFWDNQSNDASANIFKSYDDERFKYFYSPKHTLLYEARNHAIGHALGKFYAFLDVDDWWEPKKLEHQIPLFEDPKVGLVYGNYWFENQIKGSSRIQYSKSLPSGYILNKLIEHSVIGLLTIVVRKSIFMGFDSRYHIIGDFDLTINVAKSWKILCVQEPIAHYRWHGKNESINNQDLHIKEIELWRSEMESKLPLDAKKSFKQNGELLIYQKAQLYLQKKQYKDFWNCLIFLKISKETVKLVIIATFPSFILRRIRSIQ